MGALDDEDEPFVRVTDPEQVAAFRERYRGTYGREVPPTPEEREQREHEERRTG